MLAFVTGARGGACRFYVYAQPNVATNVQAALDYLRGEVPDSLLSARMHNSVAGSALHQGKPDLARAALDLMAAQRMTRDARSWAFAFRLVVLLNSRMF